MVLCITPPNFRLIAEILKELEWMDRQTDRMTDDNKIIKIGMESKIPSYVVVYQTFFSLLSIHVIQGYPPKDLWHNY